MQRRDFFRAAFATAGGLVLPYEPQRVYSFGSEAGRIEVVDWAMIERTVRKHLDKYLVASIDESDKSLRRRILGEWMRLPGSSRRRERNR